MIRSTAAALSLAAAALFVAPAIAQAPWTAEGRLQNGDDRDGDHLYDLHALLLTAGTRYRVSVESPEQGGFDTVVQLLRPGSTEPLAENDDAGGTLNSRLAFTPERSGEYLIRVHGFSPDGRGPYTIRVEPMPPLPAPISAAPGATATTTWRVWEGALGAGDPDNDGHRFDDYLVHLDAGQHFVALDATGAEPFDTLVQLLRPEAREGDPVDSDDDGGRNLNSLLVFEAAEAGDYIVRVTSFAENAAGPYRLRISD
jgi:hypothetical protein